MINILIPCAGKGQRFIDAGYKQTKPLIDVNGKPMIERVIENLTPSKEYGYKIIVMPQADMDYEFNPKIDVIKVHGITKGSVCTVLQAREYIDTDDPLIIASCDQLLDWDIDDFINKSRGLDGNLVTYKSNLNHHSYCKVERGKVTQTAEKMVISENANVGIYYFGTGRDFVTAAEKMIQAGDTFNDEYYLAPVYNYMIKDGFKNIEIYEIKEKECHILGTPVDLRRYLGSKNIKKTSR